MLEGARALERALDVLDAIVADDGRTSAAELIKRIDLPASSARRMIAVLERRGLVQRVAHGRYAGGAALTDMAGHVTPYRRLVETARPILRRLSAAEGWICHLGVYDDNDMVTYLVKEGGESIFTREGAELEAYCTGIGKALLSQLPGESLEQYLRGSFVRLTETTICEPEELRAEVLRTLERNYAIDDREMSDQIACVAVPIPLAGNTQAAISLSGDARHFPLHLAKAIARRLSGTARHIARQMTKLEDRDRALRPAEYPVGDR